MIDCSLYTKELTLWNNTHNLMAKNEISNISEHIEDSLSLIPFLEKNLDDIKSPNIIIDIGSGGGFPVIPLAFWAKENQKNLHFIATDIVDKKIAFLKWCTVKFDLNIDVIKVDKNFIYKDPCTITSRAFASVKDIITWQKKHTPYAVEFLLLKGNKVLTELEEAQITAYSLTENPRGYILKIKRSNIG
ncbi:MAG: RsmG family class I SAM-dependent methyltransferase [Brevinema sp.]